MLSLKRSFCLRFLRVGSVWSIGVLESWIKTKASSRRWTQQDRWRLRERFVENCLRNFSKHYDSQLIRRFHSRSLNALQRFLRVCKMRRLNPFLWRTLWQRFDKGFLTPGLWFTVGSPQFRRLYHIWFGILRHSCFLLRYTIYGCPRSWYRVIVGWDQIPQKRSSYQSSPSQLLLRNRQIYLEHFWLSEAMRSSSEAFVVVAIVCNPMTSLAVPRRFPVYVRRHGR